MKGDKMKKQTKINPTKWNKESVKIDEGLQRLAEFIANNVGGQDWESHAYMCSDYVAAFIGTRQKEVYGDLMEKLESLKQK